ncbi:MAG: N-acetyltransferase family protein [bacterium]|nr:N-acetyltransferase family protein [bacterium]
MQVRAARETDLAIITAIYNEEVSRGTATFDTEPRDGTAALAWFAGHSPGRHPVLVADVDGRVAGWASLSAWSPRGAYSGTVEASVFVDGRRRRRGAGRVLVAALEEAARRAGHHVILGRIEAANAPSLALFARAGYRQVGVMREVGRKFGR